MRRTASFLTLVLLLVTLAARAATRAPGTSVPGAPGFMPGIGGFSGGLFAGSRRRWR